MKPSKEDSVSSGEEKTEQATPHKLKEARKKGQVAKSVDIIAFFSFLLSFVALYGFFEVGIKKWFFYFKKINSQLNNINAESLSFLLKEGTDLWLLLSIPVLLASSLGIILASLGQFGFLFTTKTLSFSLKKINPIEGLKKIFSKNRLVELLKQLIKFSIVFFIIYRFLKDKVLTISLMTNIPNNNAFLLALEFILDITFKILLGFLAISVIDYFWQKFSFLKTMRMSKYEIKKEYKQQEGDPLLKSERKRIARELMEESSKENVKKARAIIVNPTHLAVGLEYNEKNSAAPIICAKGSQKAAKKIIRLAQYYQIPIVRNVPLARKLYHLELEQEIPESLYEVVAEVLIFINDLNNKNNNDNS